MYRRHAGTVARCPFKLAESAGLHGMEAHIPSASRSTVHSNHDVDSIGQIPYALW